MSAQCKGACCRNPFGVCSHKRDCTYHDAEKRRDQQAEYIANLDAELRAAGNLDRRRK